MTCGLGTVNKSKHTQIAGQALRDLMESNDHFHKLHAQAIIDRPRFYESYQNIDSFGQPFKVILLKNFVNWLLQKVLVINPDTMDKYIFYKEVTDPTAVGVQKYYVYVYFHT